MEPSPRWASRCTASSASTVGTAMAPAPLRCTPLPSRPGAFVRKTRQPLCTEAVTEEGAGALGAAMSTEIAQPAPRHQPKTAPAVDLVPPVGDGAVDAGALHEADEADALVAT